jgi:hypothetical protein
MEQLMVQISELNVEKELEVFHETCVHMSLEKKDEDATAIKELLQSFAKPADQVLVDADGYRIPQMDVEKWRAEVNQTSPTHNPANALFDDDTVEDKNGTQPRIKFDILQVKSTDVNTDELANAAAFMRDSLGLSASKNATISRRRQGSHATSTIEPSPALTPALAMSKSPSVTSLSAKSNSGARIQLKCMEIVNARVTPDGKLSQLYVTGALILHPESVKSVHGIVKFRINPKTGSNLVFQAPEMPGVSTSNTTDVTIDMDKAAISDPTIIKYRVDNIQASQNMIPLRVSSRMKTLPTQTQLVISYERNVESICTDPQTHSMSRINDLVILVDADSDTRAVVTKPLAAFHQEKKKIMWKMGDLNAEPGVPQDQAPTTKLLAQWEVTKQSQGSAVSVRFVCDGVRMSGVDCQLVGDDTIPLSVHSSSGCSLTIETAVFAPQ